MELAASVRRLIPWLASSAVMIQSQGERHVTILGLWCIADLIGCGNGLARRGAVLRGLRLSALHPQGVPTDLRNERGFEAGL